MIAPNKHLRPEASRALNEDGFAGLFKVIPDLSSRGNKDIRLRKNIFENGVTLTLTPIWGVYMDIPAS